METIHLEQKITSKNGICFIHLASNSISPTSKTQNLKKIATFELSGC